jgi:hypothetical protein
VRCPGCGAEFFDEDPVGAYGAGVVDAFGPDDGHQDEDDEYEELVDW